MPYIYEPKGKAREYCELALNIFKGCPHGCTYCFAPDATFREREEFHAAAVPRLEVFSTLEREAKKFKGRVVFLCFTCDPYPPEDDHMLARQAIKILHANEVKVRILTKSGARSERDFDLLAARPDLSFYGATLTFGRYERSEEWEPNAAPPGQRIAALRRAHEVGIPTWASIEPIIDVDAALHVITLSLPWVDMYKLGRWNHDKRADKIDYRAFLKEAIPLLEKLGKQYYIKKDLAVYLEG